jgi:hypothetical protein
MGRRDRRQAITVGIIMVNTKLTIATRFSSFD